jgi:hypothetical protein
MLLQCIQFFKYVAARSERALVIDGMVCLVDADVTKCMIAAAASCIYMNRKMVSTIGDAIHITTTVKGSVPCFISKLLLRRNREEPNLERNTSETDHIR